MIKQVLSEDAKSVCPNSCVRASLRTQTYFRLSLGFAENNVCEPEPGNDFCDAEILSQSQFSSSNPRTSAQGIRASHERKLQTTMAGDVIAVLGINFAMFWFQNSHLAPEKRFKLHF